jgi:hypothetical protein
MAKKKATEADLARRAQMRKNAEHTRRLAEKARAELERRRSPQAER